MLDWLRSLASGEDGATSLEYALIAVLIGAGIIVSVVQFADSLGGLFSVIEALAGIIS